MSIFDFGVVLTAVVVLAILVAIVFLIWRNRALKPRRTTQEIEEYLVSSQRRKPDDELDSK